MTRRDEAHHLRGAFLSTEHGAEVRGNNREDNDHRGLLTIVYTFIFVTGTLVSVFNPPIRTTANTCNSDLPPDARATGRQAVRKKLVHPQAAF